MNLRPEEQNIWPSISLEPNIKFKIYCAMKSLIPPLIFISLQVIIGIVMTASALINFTNQTELDPFASEEAMAQFVASGELIYATLLSLVYSGIISMALFTILYRRRNKKPADPERAKCSANHLWKPIVIGILANFAVQSFVNLFQSLAGTELPVSTLEPIINAIEDTSGMLLIALAVIVLAPLTEELCFRGLTFNRLSRAFPFWLANIIQAALFGLVHMQLIQSIYAFLAGLIFGWLYHITGRFEAAIIAHVAFNLTPFVAGLIPAAILASPFIFFFAIGIPSVIGLYLLYRDMSAKLKREVT